MMYVAMTTSSPAGCKEYYNNERVFPLNGHIQCRHVLPYMVFSLSLSLRCLKRALLIILIIPFLCVCVCVCVCEGGAINEPHFSMKR